MLSREEVLSLFTRISDIAASHDTAVIVNGLLDESLQCCPAKCGMVFLQTPQLRSQLRIIKGDFTDCANFAGFITTAKQIARRSEQMRESILCRTPEEIFDTFHLPMIDTFKQFPSLLSYPLMYQKQVLGVLLLMDVSIPADMECLQIIEQRLVSELSKTLAMENQILHNEQLLSLIETLGQIGSTLEEEEILEKIITNGRLLTNAEACSLFLIEEETKEIVLTLSSNLDERISRHPLDIRVPFGEGIIGSVVESGVPAIVQDTKVDTRHYKKSDAQIGFATRSLLAVPMRSHSINLQTIEENVGAHIIGGLEAVNKVGGDFTDNDQQILQILANQAATVLEIARAYRTINEIFIDVTRALSAAIDAKDPYTVGHSLRVSNFATVLAEQMGFSRPIVQQIRLGGLLHDVGKIGIPDDILKKPARLSVDEYMVIKQHPAIGFNIMHQVRKMENVIPGLIQHHERLDGSGYPNGLTETEISLAAKIIAVADVFDALTSDRLYRKAYSAQDALQMLQDEANTHLDSRCVHELVKAYQTGKIKSAAQDISDTSDNLSEKVNL